jgi:hypothetical protein
MAPKSKFSVGDRVWFTYAGPRFKQEGSVQHVRKDGLLFVHFDGDPPGADLIVQPYEVDPISTKKRYEAPSHAVKKTPPAQLDREIAEALVPPKSSRALAAHKPQRGWDLTEELARTLPRFEFVAHWLAVVTKKKENRGPLGLYVKHLGKKWQVVSPIGGGTVTFETTDPALLFDYARRGQLGREIRNAEEFRILAHEA